MSEIMKDSAIKLFGKTITLLPDDVVSDVYVSQQRQSSFATSNSPDHKDEHESTDQTRETLTEASTTSNIEDEANTPETPKKEESHDSNTPEEKPLKKPDKILPCPRCKSMDTKFCYYNNYNVNQPRYFCKNCQRYWTSGGTMRNVPVGSGRRKIKNPNPNPGEPGFLIGPDSGFPVSFYPATTYWTVPLVASSLGKHSRDENMVRTSQDNLKAKRSVWTPKTLRVHDQSEAAKSSVWVTLGRIENQKTGLFNGSGLFKAFGSRGVDSATIVRQANPAALSRSRA